MLQIKNVRVYDLERAVVAVNNSFNAGEINTLSTPTEQQWRIAKTLGGNGDAHQSHDAFLKGILCSFDMKFSQAFTTEFERYHFANIVMSQSTMHSLEKFMDSSEEVFSEYVLPETKVIVRKCYEEWLTIKERLKVDGGEVLKAQEYDAFMRLRHNLPAGLEMWMTISTNYLQLKTICIQRQHHRQHDWWRFCEAVYQFPHFTDLTGLPISSTSHEPEKGACRNH